MSSNPSLRGAVDLSALVNRALTGQQAAAGTSPSGASSSGTDDQHEVQSNGAGSWIINATDANFGQVLEISKQVPVVVDLWATWCGPCTQLTPILEKLTREFAGRILLAKVDVDQNPQLAQAFGAQSIPTVAAVVAGQPVPMFTGAIPEQQVREVFEQLVQVAEQNGVSGTLPGNPDSDGVGDGDSSAPATAADQPVELPPLHQQAFDAINAGDFAAAEQAYRKAIAEQPADQEAKAGLAQVQLLQRLQGKSLDEIRQAAAMNPTDVEAQLAVADLDLSGGHIEDAFDRLLELFRVSDQDTRTIIRDRLLQLFLVVGVGDPRVETARGRLASLLF